MYAYDSHFENKNEKSFQVVGGLKSIVDFIVDW